MDEARAKDDDGTGADAASIVTVEREREGRSNSRSVVGAPIDATDACVASHRETSDLFTRRAGESQNGRRRDRRCRHFKLDFRAASTEDRPEV
jgi:hypothetical protein